MTDLRFEASSRSLGGSPRALLSSYYCWQGCILRGTHILAAIISYFVALDQDPRRPQPTAGNTRVAGSRFRASLSNLFDDDVP